MVTLQRFKYMIYLIKSNLKCKSWIFCTLIMMSNYEFKKNGRTVAIEQAEKG